MNTWCYSEVNHDDRPLCAAYSLILETSFLMHAEIQTQWQTDTIRDIWAFILFIDTLPQKSLCSMVFPLNNFKKHCSLKNYKMLNTKCTWNNNTRLRKHQLNLYLYFTNHPSYPNFRNDIHFKVSKIEFWCLRCHLYVKWEHIVRSLVSKEWK